MAKRANEFKVGLTVIIIGVVFLAIVLTLGDWQGLVRKEHTYRVRFPASESLLGLSPNDPVKVAETVVAGQVRRVDLESAEKARDADHAPEQFLTVEFALDERVKLFSDCRITVVGSPLGGNTFLNIQKVGSKRPEIKPGATITGTAPASLSLAVAKLDAQLDADNPDSFISKLKAQLDERNPASLLYDIKRQLDPHDAEALMFKVHKTVDRINDTMIHLRAASARIETELDRARVGSAMAKLHAGLDNVQALTGSLRSQLDAAEPGTLLAKVHEGLDKINASLTGIRRTVETINTSITPRVAHELDRESPESLLAKIHAGADALRETLANLRQVSKTGRDLVVLNRDYLDQLVLNLKETSDHLKTAAKEIRRNPWRLFYKPDEKQTRELNIFDAARAFAEAATRLNDASTKLRALSAAYKDGIPPGDPQLRTVRDQLDKAFKQFSHAERKLWEELK